MEWEIDPTVQLRGAIDVEQLRRDMRGDFTLKGMFFRRVAKELGSSLATLIDQLEEPPGRAGWLPFRDYPQSDYSLLSVAAARHRYPRLSDREALRRLARADIGVFIDSMIGRVMMSVIGDTRRALNDLPKVYEKVAPGPWGFETAFEGERSLHLSIANHPGEWCYQVGQCEGIAAHYGDGLRTHVDADGRSVRFLFRW